jgi:hypothetical protein
VASSPRPSRAPRAEPPALAVSAQDCRRANDHQVIPPSARPQPPRPDPEDAVLVEQARAWVRPEGYVEPVSEDQVLKSQVPPGSKQRCQAAEEQFEHPAGYPLVAASSLGFVLDPDLPPYSLSLSQRPRSVRLLSRLLSGGQAWFTKTSIVVFTRRVGRGIRAVAVGIPRPPAGWSQPRVRSARRKDVATDQAAL